MLRIKSLNDGALLVIVRIASGRQHDTHSGTFVPVCLRGVKPAGQGQLAKLSQVRLQPHHDRLGFRVSKATVEFHYAGVAVLVNHESCVEKSDVGMAVTGHARDSRTNDLLHDPLMNSMTHHGCR